MTSQTYKEMRAVIVMDSGNVEEIQYLTYASQTLMLRATKIQIP